MTRFTRGRGRGRRLHGRFAVRAFADQAETAMRLVNVAAAFQAGEQLGQRAAAPVTQVERGGDFANALRASGAGKVSQQGGFVDFLRRRGRAVLIGMPVFFLHERRMGKD